MGDVSDKRFLIVEDCVELARHLTRDLLKKGGHVFCAATLLQARRALAERIFDVVVIDLYLPDGNGRDLVSLVRKLDPSPIIIIMSAGLQAAQVVELMPYCHASLPKPVFADDLAGVLAHVTRTAKAPPDEDARARRHHHPPPLVASLATALARVTRSFRLTPVEADVLACAVMGMNRASTADVMNQSEETAKSHRRRICKKTEARNLREVVELVFASVDVSERDRALDLKA
jgi:DNA-binding NarL/FixJ family response regulator